jgi:excisionase family DNA binding protein
VAQVAERWSVSADTIYGLLRKGNLPFYRFGDCIRIREMDVVDYEQPQPADSTSVAPRARSR